MGLKRWDPMCGLFFTLVLFPLFLATSFGYPQQLVIEAMIEKNYIITISENLALFVGDTSISLLQLHAGVLGQVCGICAITKSCA